MSSSLFEHIPDDLPEELTQILAAGANVRIERILSHGQVSPPDFWYEQEETEFVVVLQGEGHIEYESGEVVRMLPGSYEVILPFTKHRVSFTSHDEATVWLAVFY